VLICRFLLDLDEAETAAVLGVAQGTVKSRSHRGLGRLRSSLAPAAKNGTEGVQHA
jgi:RNA polymerase sigma-70 factor (ECF subfamily)